MNQNYARLLQSATAYASASLITVTLHEFGHGLVAVLLGEHPMVYGLHEDDAANTNAAVGAIAGAGPVVSLVLGILFTAVYDRLRGQCFGRYLLLWLGLLGVATFFGYLLTAPFFTTGDVDVVLKSLHLTSPISVWLLFAIGTAGIFLLGWIGLPRLLKLTNRDMPLRAQMWILGPGSWVLGGGVALLATSPSPTYMFFMTGTFTTLINWFASRRDSSEPHGEPRAMPKFNGIELGLLSALVVVEHTVLRHGVRL
jgi:hypothetical protein